MQFMSRSQAVVIGFMVCVFCGVLFVIKNNTSWNKAYVKHKMKVEELTTQVNRLALLAQANGGNDFKANITLQGSYGSDSVHHKNELIQWQQATKLTVNMPCRQEGKKRICQYGTPYMTVIWLQDAIKGIYYTISLQASSKSEFLQAVQTARQLLFNLADHYKATWGATIQTTTMEPLCKAFAKAERSLKKWGQTIPLDRYEDKHTISVSYQTNYMDVGVNIKQHIANLQLAVHENKHKNRTQITLGTPLITME